jgi:hypothetical protein
MGLLSRLAGGLLVGPIGLTGPTEASKRSKKQLAEMKRQTALLEDQLEDQNELSVSSLGSRPEVETALQWAGLETTASREGGLERSEAIGPAFRN